MTQTAKKTPFSMNVDLMHGPIFKNLLLFMLPIFISSLFQQLYNTVDTMIVGNVLGDTALAAIGACGAIYELLVGFGIGIGNGLAIVAARAYGAGDEDQLKQTVAGSIVIGIIASAVITLAGGDSVGFVDGDLKSARFNQPYGVALDAAQTTLYVADYLNHAIRRINLVLEKVDTLAGNGAPGFADGRRGTARFNQPYNVRVDGLGRIWVPDQLNHAVRRVTPAGEVSTVAGSGKAGYIDGATTAAQFNNPTGIAPLPNGAAVVADRNNNRLRLVTPDGSVTTLAGNGEAGFADGPVANARFNQPLDVDFDDSMSRILVSEDKGHRLRVLPKDTGKASAK